jgi:hypothetical protein
MTHPTIVSGEDYIQSCARARLKVYLFSERAEEPVITR